MPWFRGDNDYVWQYRQTGPGGRLKRYLALREIEASDPCGLIARLGEDGLFGCWVERYGNLPPVSRDLLDSVAEINFLEKHVGLSSLPALRVLDIGAGYGRLAHRMAQAFPNLTRYDCVDAIPESTFLCEYYLKFRGVTPRARAVPLPQIREALPVGGYDVAVNIHSFTECSYAAIEWWLKLVKDLGVPWLLILPNHPDELRSTEADHSHRDFMPLVQASGYRLEVKAPVYPRREVQDLIGVRDHFFLFRRES
jgi:hypothetical protein